MYIETETTPNPAALKFLPGRHLLIGEPVDLASPEEADARSPLAAAFFSIDAVTRVLIGTNFVVVTLSSADLWQAHKPVILSILMEGLILDTPIVSSYAVQENGPIYDPADEPIVAQIRELLDERIRPSVAMDGGDIVLQGFDKGVVFLAMRGACAGCPSSTATLKGGIENMLRHFIPEVVEVRAAGM